MHSADVRRVLVSARRPPERSRLRRAAGVAAAFLLAFAFVHAGWAADEHDRLARGPQVGAPIPHALTTTDHAGTPQDFDTVIGERGLVLIFSRSLDWCVYCKRQAIVWNERLAEVTALGYAVAILTYDSPTDLRRFAGRRKIGYTLLSDPDSEIIRAFDLLNERYRPGSYAHGVPHPAIFVVDPDRTITHRFSEETYRNRPEIDVVLDALRNADTRRADG